jgi:hypothetical protein
MKKLAITMTYGDPYSTTPPAPTQPAPVSAPIAAPVAAPVARAPKSNSGPALNSRFTPEGMPRFDAGGGAPAQNAAPQFKAPRAQAPGAPAAPNGRVRVGKEFFSRIKPQSEEQLMKNPNLAQFSGDIASLKGGDTPEGRARWLNIMNSESGGGKNFLGDLNRGVSIGPMQLNLRAHKTSPWYNTVAGLRGKPINQWTPQERKSYFSAANDVFGREGIGAWTTAHQLGYTNR